MKTAVDSSVLLDVITGDVRFADASESLLRRAMQEGSLIACECVVAEIRPAFPAGGAEAFLDDLGIEFTPSSRESALLAGEMFKAYLERKSRDRSPSKTASRVVADFLVGAHAQTLADRLLARDRGFYRDYFERLVLLTDGKASGSRDP